MYSIYIIINSKEEKCTTALDYRQREAQEQMASSKEI